MDDYKISEKIDEFIGAMNDDFVTAFREDRLGDDAMMELQAFLAIRVVLQDYKVLRSRVGELERKVEKLSKKKEEGT